MAVNATISGSRVFLFLGAGASKPFGGLLMSEFITELKYRLVSSGEKDLRSLIDTLVEYTEWDIEALLKELRDIGEKRYLADKSRINYINNFLDSDEEREERRVEREKIQGGGLGTGYYVGSVKEIPGFSKRYSELVKMCKNLRTFVEKLIFEHYGKLDNSLVVGTYMPIINILSERLNQDKILPIFTTNYDCIIEDYQKFEYKKVCMVDGFGERIPESREMTWDRKVFDNFQAKKDKINIVLFKLHGSVNWYESSGRIIYSPTPIHQEKKSRFNNVLIYPAMDKIAIEDPYFTCYDYFQRCLDNAAFGMFIGYSFRDYDTVTKIRSGLNNNSELRLIVFGPNTRELIDSKFPDFGNRFTPIEYDFGKKAHVDKYLEQLKKALEK